MPERTLPDFKSSLEPVADHDYFTRTEAEALAASVQERIPTLVVLAERGNRFGGSSIWIGTEESPSGYRIEKKSEWERWLHVTALFAQAYQSPSGELGNPSS